MSNDTKFQYLRSVDFAALHAKGKDEKFHYKLIDHLSGATSCWVKFGAVPPGGGSGGAHTGAPQAGANSPEVLHFHDNDQMFYLMDGVMDFEIDGEFFQARPGTLVVVPAGVVHRHWNSGTEDNHYISIDAPAPDPDKPKHYPAPR